MLFTDVIRAKRDGGALSDEQIRYFVDGLADGSLPAEQVSALAMAIFLNGMSFEEASTLTFAMANSGTVLDWSNEDLDGPVVDKHSTGGVGDKVSFLLAPIAAACGCYVPMISGRGLGHTGGTTDKVESIPGYESGPSFEKFRDVVKTVGCSIIGQTSDLAPADRRLYSIRDVTGTVESIPLITASILSKKIASGLGALVMDIKTGNGASIAEYERSRDLAQSIIGTAALADVKCHAVITDMNEVLGNTVGNALEIVECMHYLTGGDREARLDEVTLALCAEMLIASGAEPDRDAALQRCDEAVTSGKAAEVFGRMCAAMGGPNDFVEKYDHYLAAAPIKRAVHADGVLAGVDTRAVGNALIELGGGRQAVDDVLDLSVGFTDFVSIGTKLDGTTPLAVIHAGSEADAENAEKSLLAACDIGADAPADRKVIYEVLTG